MRIFCDFLYRERDLLNKYRDKGEPEYMRQAPHDTGVIGAPTRTMDIEKAEKTRMTFGTMDIEKRIYSTNKEIKESPNTCVKHPMTQASSPPLGHWT